MYSTNENKEKKTKLEKKAFKAVKEKTLKEMQSEMFEEIYNYSIELRDKNFNIKYPRLAHYKKNLYPALDNLLKQCDMIRDEKLKASKLRIIYVWFCQKKNSYFNLSNMDKMTVKQDYQKIEEPYEAKYKPYQAINYNLEFEKDRRTEIASLEPAKIRIKEYRAKKILPDINSVKDVINKTNNKENRNDLWKSPINSPSNSINMTTTRYITNIDSSAFKNAIFNRTTRIVVTTKSYDKSQHQKFPESNLDIDNVKAKNREIAEKRSMSEVKMYMDDWAMIRSKLNEQVQRKSEMKHLLKNYDTNTIKEEKVTLETNSKSKEIDNENELNNHSSLVVEKVSTKKVRNVVKNKIGKSKLIVKKIKIQSKSNQNSPEKKSKILNYNLFNLDVIPTDIYSEMMNSIKSLKVRNLYGEAINVNTISNNKNDYIANVKPLSMLDYSNHIKTEVIKDKSKRSISLDLKEVNPEKYNMLSQRKTLSVFNYHEMTRLKGELSKENINIPINTLKRAFLPPEVVVYPKHYLPNSGFGLLTNPFADSKRKNTKI